MATQERINQLPAATAVTDTSQIPNEDSANLNITEKFTALQLYAYLSGKGFVSTSTQNTFTKSQVVTPVAVTSASNHVATNASLSDIFTLALTENTTIDNPTNLTNGQYIEYRITQDSTPRTVSWGNKFQWPGTTTMIVSTGSRAVDIVGGRYFSDIDKIKITGYAQGIA